MEVTLLKTGNKFKFPDDETMYEFYSIHFVDSTAVVTYFTREGEIKQRDGFSLSDLIPF